MIKLRNRVLLAGLVGLASAAGCGDDDDPPSGGKGGSAGQSGASAKGGTAGGTSKGGTTSKGGNSGAGKASTEEGGAPPTEGGAGPVVEGGRTGTGGTANPEGGSGGAPVEPGCNIYDSTRPVADIPVDAQNNLKSGATFTLTRGTTWRINGRIFVPDGVTLNVEPCTLIVGSPKPNGGTLFIQQGAKLIAEGTADEPIVFSSEDQLFHTNTPWGGVVLLGRAPIGPADAVTVNPARIFEGLTDVRATYGGSDPADSSGSLAYVRIEYGGDIIAADKEVNGLTLAGVGSETSLHHIMVKRQLDDCFEFFGGTVDAHHLICENPGDDMFDTDEKYKGHLQFLFGRLTLPGTSADPNGFEWDGNQPNQAVPERGTPQAANATLCGLNLRAAAVSYGAVLRRGLQSGTSLVNTIVTGFENGVDTRDLVGTTALPTISWTNSLFFGQTINDIAIATEATDNDSAFDELSWILTVGSGNDTTEPPGFDCYSDPPTPFPTTAVTGGTPAAPFESTAEYVGAFSDESDNWMTGAWVNWDSGS